MPGITANLSNAAFAIWEEVPRKTRQSPLGDAGERGRSAWLSAIILDHHQQMILHSHQKKELSRSNREMKERLLNMTAARDKLQDIVKTLLPTRPWPRTDDPKS